MPSLCGFNGSPYEESDLGRAVLLAYPIKVKHCDKAK